MKKTCAICGKPSGMYPLCTYHFKLKDEGKVVKCENCGKWHMIEEPCGCKKITELPKEGYDKCQICGKPTTGYAFCRDCWNTHSEDELLAILNGEMKQIEQTNEPKTIEENPVVIIDENNKFACLVCGKKTDGLLFCPSCYRKYKDKKLIFKITKCSTVELLDEDYEGSFVCKDGHVVKSKSEREIDDYLYEHAITHAYEKAYSYGQSDKENIHPDFYLPNYLGLGKDVYVEHWGYDETNVKYTQSKNFKMEIYKKDKVTLINLYEADQKDIENTLQKRLDKRFIKEGEINY